MSKTTLGFGLICAVTLAWPAAADDFSRMCRRDARAEYKDCRETCREEVQLEKDICKERNHDCAEQCRDTKADCRAPTLAAVLVCVDQAKDTFVEAVENCRESYSGDDNAAARDICVDGAQLIYFIQRDECREQFDLASTLGDCREDFRSCMRQCEPVD